MKKVLNIFTAALLCFYSSCTKPDSDCAKSIKDCFIDKMVNDAEIDNCMNSALTQYLNVDSLPKRSEFPKFIKDNAMSEKIAKLAIALRVESRSLNAPELNSNELDELEEALEGLSEFFDKISTN